MTTTPFKRLAIAIASGAVLVAGLSACVPLVVGGAAAVGMGMVATDRRSSGAQLDDQGIEVVQNLLQDHDSVHRHRHELVFAIDLKINRHLPGSIGRRGRITCRSHRML